MIRTIEEMWEIALLALCVWREAQDQTIPAKRAVAWSVRNRVYNHVHWDGDDYPGVILKPKQYSSFNPGDPNAAKMPIKNDTAWIACLQIANDVYDGIGDNPIGAATHYYDKSLDANPPEWSQHMTHICDVGDFHFFLQP